MYIAVQYFFYFSVTCVDSHHIYNWCFMKHFLNITDKFSFICRNCVKHVANDYG